MVQKSCWPVEVGSFSHYVQGFTTIPGGWPWDFWTINSMGGHCETFLFSPPEMMPGWLTSAFLRRACDPMFLGRKNLKHDGKKGPKRVPSQNHPSFLLEWVVFLFFFLLLWIPTVATGDEIYRASFATDWSAGEAQRRGNPSPLQGVKQAANVWQYLGIAYICARVGRLWRSRLRKEADYLLVFLVIVLVLVLVLLVLVLLVLAVGCSCAWCCGGWRRNFGFAPAWVPGASHHRCMLGRACALGPRRLSVATGSGGQFGITFSSRSLHFGEIREKQVRQYQTLPCHFTVVEVCCFSSLGILPVPKFV